MRIDGAEYGIDHLVGVSNLQYFTGTSLSSFQFIEEICQDTSNVKQTLLTSKAKTFGEEVTSVTSRTRVCIVSKCTSLIVLLG